jgi:uncharacterized repeat protein (TIGR03803 family)
VPRKFHVGLTIILEVFCAVLLLTSTRATAQTVKVVHAFGHGRDGDQPSSSLIFDANGNLYGTTEDGGIAGPVFSGTVFELIPETGGGWTEKVLHSFSGGESRAGYAPSGGLIFDAAGNIYGTTIWGGNGEDPPCDSGCGTVFELLPTADGAWSEKVLHSFGNGADGAYPQAGLIIDSAGNLYGTVPWGGANGGGVVFSLTPRVGGGWAETVLHNFGATGTDSSHPAGNLTFDASGNLYGASLEGGSYNYGAVFELMPEGIGHWKEKTLHSFEYDGMDGVNPNGSLIFDASGNLYGTTGGGGAYNCGTAFELAPQNDGSWTEQVLHSFNDIKTDGYTPLGGLVLDASGNLYGTTVGGAYSGGTVYELTPEGDGVWTERILYEFGSGSRGLMPWTGLIFDATGNLYSTTTSGGPAGRGTAFEVIP